MILRLLKLSNTSQIPEDAVVDQIAKLAEVREKLEKALDKIDEVENRRATA